MGHKNILSQSLLILFLMAVATNMSFAQSLEQLVQENPRQALTQINKTLSNKPNDASALFLRARAYEQLGQDDRAQGYYERFVQRFPEHPEAYLNLANLYAKKGDTQSARKVLEQGLQSKSEYAKLYLNLKKLNSHLAQAAYQRALSKDKKIATPALSSTSSLALPEVRIQEVEVIKEVPVEVVKEIEIIKEVEVIKEIPVEVVKEVEIIKEVEVIKEVPVEVVKEVEVIREVPVVANNTSVKDSDQTTSTTVQKNEPAEQSYSEQSEVISIVRNWADTWSDQNVGKFVSFYAPDFSSRGKTRQQWLQDRKLKLTNKRFIKVNVKNFNIETKTNQLVEATFRQHYQSDVVSGVSQKRLTFKNINGNWKIIAETIIRQ